ncbi:MAG: T9SS type A sorting domain-containing protein [Bacteroidia bacterium]
MKYSQIVSAFSLLCLMGLSFTGTAQSLDRFVIGVTGGTATAGNAQIEYTVGEMAVTTLETGAFILNQGFHQSNPPFNTAIEKPLQISLSYKLYPNPTNGKVQLELEAGEVVDLKIAVYDVQGRLTSVTAQNFSRQKNINTEFDLSQQASGLYFIRVLSPNGEIAKSFKVEKR